MQLDDAINCFVIFVPRYQYQHLLLAEKAALTILQIARIFEILLCHLHICRYACYYRKLQLRPDQLRLDRLSLSVIFVQMMFTQHILSYAAVTSLTLPRPYSHFCTMLSPVFFPFPG